MNTPTEKLVLILGMHRSGTSSLAGMLKHYGLHLGEEISTQNKHNLKGNQEHYPARKINNALIKLHGGSWFDPKVVTEVSEEQFVEINALKAQFRIDAPIYGIKDPRMLFCTLAWQDEHTEYVGTIRHPALVWKSLETRNALLPDKVIADWNDVWYAYNKRLLELYLESPFPIVNFDWPASRYQQAVKAIALYLGLTGEDAFFDPELRHQETADLNMPAQCLELYQQLNEIAETEEIKLKNQSSNR